MKIAELAVGTHVRMNVFQDRSFEAIYVKGVCKKGTNIPIFGLFQPTDETLKKTGVKDFVRSNFPPNHYLHNCFIADDSDLIDLA